MKKKKQRTSRTKRRPKPLDHLVRVAFKQRTDVIALMARRLDDNLASVLRLEEMTRDETAIKLLDLFKKQMNAQRLTLKLLLQATVEEVEAMYSKKEVSDDTGTKGDDTEESEGSGGSGEEVHEDTEGSQEPQDDPSGDGGEE